MFCPDWYAEVTLPIDAAIAAALLILVVELQLREQSPAIAVTKIEEHKIQDTWQ